MADPGIIWLRNDPLLVSLRADPRFGVLFQQMKLPASR